MSELVAVGINHKTAPVELREKVASSAEDLHELLLALRQDAGLQEAMIVSTCNRVEIFGVCRGWAQAGERSLRVLAEHRGVAPESLLHHSFVRGSRDAIAHIFRVAASLESMVVGEPQILGQVKESFELARSHGTVGAILDRCLTSAFRGAKRVRTETAIARGAASVPSVAVDLARSIFGELSDCTALLVGAGEMSQQSGINLRSAGISSITVVNRSGPRGQALAAELRGHYVPWEGLSEQLARADIVITSTGSQHPVIDRALLRPVMRTRRGAPIFLVDIAVPRDVDPDVLKIGQVFVYNIDDLQGIVDQNLRSRETEAMRASELLEVEIDAFVAWLRGRSVGPVIQRLHEHARSVADGELARLGGRLGELTPGQRKVVESLAHGIVRKLLHHPVTSLRESASGEESYAATALVSAVEVLFKLEEESVSEQVPSLEKAVPAGAKPAKA